MPLFRVKDQLYFFAHVPKCAGSAIERYLEARFGELAFKDERHLLVRPSQRWSKGSPQHITAAALERLLPDSYLHASFAMVRHPYKRLLSVFLYQRDVERILPVETDFGTFLADLPRRWKRQPFYLDNHPRPMTDLVPDGAVVFRLEDGTGALIDWLDALAGDSDGPRELPSVNSYRQQLYQRRLEPGPETELTEKDRAAIATLYAVDFERFGYGVDGGTVGGHKDEAADVWQDRSGRA